MTPQHSHAHAYNEFGYCKSCGHKLPASFTPNAEHTWPSDTWFRRALQRLQQTSPTPLIERPLEWSKNRD